MKKTTNTAHLTIDLNDVVRAGGVRQAIAAWCEDSDDTSCGVIGPEFSTSGPGSGWSRNHDASDFASRAFSEGAMHYLDLDDGRMISSEPADDADEGEDGELPDGVYRDIGGCLYREGDWTDESVVCLACPDVEDALDHPELVAEMAKAVIDCHHAESDCGRWRKLVEAIRASAEALEEINLDRLPE